MSAAIILINMGGPESIDDIELYLRNLFNDPDIIDIKLPAKIKKSIIHWILKKRFPKTRYIYQQIGGSSPLNKITREQADLLETKINNKNKIKYDVYYALRYCKPYFTSIWEDLLKKKYHKVIIFPLYPQFSYATTGSLIRLWRKLNHSHPDTKIIRSYYDHPEYIKANVKRIKMALPDLLKNNDRIELIMTAHGLPMRYIKKGDPYAVETECTVKEIMHHLPTRVNVHLAYQSKIGPLRWLKPDTVDILRKLAKRKVKKVFVYPVSFVADNSETLYEIDILYRNLARKWGITDFNFIHPFNDHPIFIEVLKRIIVELVEGRLDKKYIYHQ
jgi:ferrochelatase